MNRSQALSATALSYKRPNITHPSKQTRWLNKMHTHINHIQHTNHSSISYAYQSPILLTFLSSLQFAAHNQLRRKISAGKVLWALREGNFSKRDTGCEKCLWGLRERNTALCQPPFCGAVDGAFAKGNSCLRRRTPFAAHTSLSSLHFRHTRTRACVCVCVCRCACVGAPSLKLSDFLFSDL